LLVREKADYVVLILEPQLRVEKQAGKDVSRKYKKAEDQTNKE
jgi:hypothetical protein